MSYLHWLIGISVLFVVLFRFHWFEIVVYKSAQWLPLALLGASPTGDETMPESFLGELVWPLARRRA
jgi:hypothetical protein